MGYYQMRGILRKVDAGQAIDRVSRDLMAILADPL
jgi:hypothetical protein